jgi:hypothetical protein
MGKDLITGGAADYSSYQLKNCLVVGQAINYDFASIEPWIVSLRRTGYNGKVVLLVNNPSLQDHVKDYDVHLVMTNPSSNVSSMVLRFFDIYKILDHNEMSDVDFVVATDVKDVIFQEDPNLLRVDNKIIVAREGFTYDIEPWSKNNMRQSYGDQMYDKMKDCPIYCAGVIAGEKNLFQFLMLCLSSLGFTAPQHPQGGGGPDQAALNILLHSEVWKNFVYETEEIIHAGTSLPGIKAGNGDIGMSYRNSPQVLEYYQSNYNRSDIPENLSSTIINKKIDRPYVIVHQYNRIPEWNVEIQKEYKH